MLANKLCDIFFVLGFEVDSEPTLSLLQENYIMIFRPLRDDELKHSPGFGWADPIMPASSALASS